VFGLLLGVTNEPILGGLRKSLAEVNVKLVTVQNALESCILAWALGAEAPGPTMKSEERDTNLITAASLGKEALEMLQLQQPISDWLTTALVIEHLKQVVIEGVLGWVLVDFPSTFEQCRIFEASVCL
jgi:hypothetical protein